MEGFGALPLMLSGSSMRILERLHLGESSRENKLQIPAQMGKGLCLRRQHQGPWQRLRQAWLLPATGLVWSLPGPGVLHGLHRRFYSQATMMLFAGVAALGSPVRQQLLLF